MTLSDKNIFVRFYRLIKHKDPNDFCGLFWFCFWWPVIIFLNIVSVFRIGWIYPLILIGVTLFVFAIIALIVWIGDKLPARESKTTEKQSSKFMENLRIWYGAIRQKHCAKIIIKEIV